MPIEISSCACGDFFCTAEAIMFLVGALCGFVLRYVVVWALEFARARKRTKKASGWK